MFAEEDKPEEVNTDQQNVEIFLYQSDVWRIKISRPKKTW